LLQLASDRNKLAIDQLASFIWINIQCCGLRSRLLEIGQHPSNGFSQALESQLVRMPFSIESPLHHFGEVLDLPDKLQHVRVDAEKRLQKPFLNFTCKSAPALSKLIDHRAGYLATLLGSTDEQTMRWFILVVALLLDPAAVLLLLAATQRGRQ
jgi:hypothetical protein